MYFWVVWFGDICRSIYTLLFGSDGPPPKHNAKTHSLVFHRERRGEILNQDYICSKNLYQQSLIFSQTLWRFRICSCSLRMWAIGSMLTIYKANVAVTMNSNHYQFVPNGFHTTLFEQATKSLCSVADCWCRWYWEKPVDANKKNDQIINWVIIHFVKKIFTLIRL